MKIRRIPLWGWFIFAVTYFALHLVWVVVVMVFFGAQGKSTRSADFIIFGVMLGFLLTLGSTLGYAVVSLAFSLFGPVSGRVEVFAASVAATVSYGFSQTAAWRPLREALEGLVVGDNFSIAIPPLFLAFACGLLVLSAATIIVALSSKVRE